MNCEISLKSYKEINKGNLIGKCIALVPIWINNMTYWREEVYTIFKRKADGLFFLKYPSQEYTNKEGEKKEEKLVSWKMKEGSDAFLNKILSLCGLDKKQGDLPF